MSRIPPLFTMALLAGALGCLTPGCKPKKMTQAQICKKGCEYRLACIEEMELDKSVTEANRAIVKQAQQKKHAEYLSYCVQACKKGGKRFRGYAACGLKAKTCGAFFQCARKVEQAEKKAKAVNRRK